MAEMKKRDTAKSNTKSTQNKGTKRKTSQKTGATQVKKSSQKGSSVKRTRKVQKTKKLSAELKGIILVALGAFLALAFFTNAAGVFGEFIQKLVMGLFGGASKIFFVYIIWMGINTFLERHKGQGGYKPAVLFGLMISSAVFVALCMEDTAWFKDGFVGEIKNMFEYGADGYGGGLIGSTICRLLYRFTGWGAWIITITLMLVLLVILTETSLEKLVKSIGEKIKKNTVALHEHLNKEIEIEAEDEEYEDSNTEDLDDDIEEIKVNKKGRKKAEKPEVSYENEVKYANNDYFDLYFSGQEAEALSWAVRSDVGTENDTKTYDETDLPKERFSFSDEDLEALGLSSDITFETEETSETETTAEYKIEAKRSYNAAAYREVVLPKSEGGSEPDGILTTMPDEKGKYHAKGEEEDFEPPSLTQIKEAADPFTRAAIDSGVPLDEAVMAGKKLTKQEAEEAANQINAVAAESIEATRLLNYKMPPISLLSKPKAQVKSKTEIKQELESKANRLLDTLASFKVDAKILNITQGPSVTRFELQPGFGVKVSKITHLADDIALSLAAPGVRIEAPIPGKSAIGIEIPNEKPAPVPIREVLDTDKFKDFKSKTAFALGKDISGNCVVADIAQFPHILIAGATGSGKSVCINSLIASILYKAKPNEVKLIMIDPKMVELTVYNGIPHLLIPVVTDPKHAAGALNWAVTEMKNRYKLLKDNKVRNLEGFNALMEENETPELKLPEIVIIIDELADLMLAAKSEVEDAINSLAALARAAGMYLVIATQRPSVDVITGVIKANVPSRISFAVSSQIDSRTILDAQGAEKLLGKGDMLYSPRGAIKPMRIQGNFLSDGEIEDIIGFIKNQFEASYDESIMEHIEREQDAKQAAEDEPETKTREGERDELFYKAAEMFVDAGQGSVAMLQRRYKIGYQRAARLIDQLEEARILGAFEGSKPRQVLISRQEFNEMMINKPE